MTFIEIDNFSRVFLVLFLFGWLVGFNLYLYNLNTIRDEERSRVPNRKIRQFQFFKRIYKTIHKSLEELKGCNCLTYLEYNHVVNESFEFLKRLDTISAMTDPIFIHLNESALLKIIDEMAFYLSAGQIIKCQTNIGKMVENFRTFGSITIPESFTIKIFFGCCPSSIDDKEIFENFITIYLEPLEDKLKYKVRPLQFETHGEIGNRLNQKFKKNLISFGKFEISKYNPSFQFQ
jgi:hypothetical protein